MYSHIKKSLFSDWLPLPPRHSFPPLLIWGLVCLVLCKLILTSQEEILAVYLPHDDLWQIRAAARAYWGGHYSPDKLFHLPIFPIFVEITRLLGVPLRLLLEIVYCGAACLLTTVLWRTGSPVVVTLLAAVVLIFHPASFQLPNRCGAEILLTPLMMVSIATSLMWWIMRDRLSSWRYAVHAGIWWAFAWNVRKESIVIIPIIMALFVFAMLVDRRAGWAKAVIGIALMLSLCLAMETAIKTANWLRWGLFATSLQTASGFKSAIKSLQSIRPEPALAFIPVPAEVRQRAYAVSPTFATLRPFLEGAAMHGWMVHSKPFTDSKGLTGLGDAEVSAGWFYWAFYDAVVAAGYGTNPREADRLLAQIGTEVRSALSDGRLASRWTPMAMVDPAWTTWLPRLPESLLRVGCTFIKPVVPNRPSYDRAVEESCGSEFDRIANRRAHLIVPRYGKGEIVGWAFASDGWVQAVEIRSPSERLLSRSPLDISRPDVDSSRPVGFRNSFIVPSEDSWQHAEVAVVLADGRVARSLLSNIPIAQVVDMPIDKTIVHFAIDLIQNPKFKVNRLWQAQAYIESWYLTLQSWLLWPGVLATLAVVITSTARRRPVDIAIALLAVAVVTRLFFFAILDASAWQGDQPRYLYAAYPLFSLALLLVYARSFSILTLWKWPSPIAFRRHDSGQCR